MQDFIANFILSAKSGYVYFGLGHEYTPWELIEIARETFTLLFP